MAKSRHVFAEKGNSSTSIFTIARNLSIDRRRRERVFQRLPVWRSEKASDEDPADVALKREERYAASCEALKTLPPEQLGITTLSNLDGLSHGEVADEQLHVPLGTWKSRIRLAYNEPRAMLDELK